MLANSQYEYVALQAMSAKMQSKLESYQLQAQDLLLLLALHRSGKLETAAARLGQDPSTVFRQLQKLEKQLACSLFARTRQGYQALPATVAVLAQAEMVELALEQAKLNWQQQPGQVQGVVSITTTDTILHGLLAPALKSLRQQHPLLQYEIRVGNQLENLSRRDADIALRATNQPPGHLLGRCLGQIEVALYAALNSSVSLAQALNAEAVWAAPDQALPQHPSVLWRRQHHPEIRVSYLVDSIQSVAELVAQDLAVGVLPVFLAEQRPDLRALSAILPDCSTELWLLSHHDTRHILRIATVYQHLAQNLRLDHRPRIGVNHE